MKKKHLSIGYHNNREAVASGTIRIAKEDSETNLADLFTKLLSEERRNFLIDRFMYWQPHGWGVDVGTSKMEVGRTTNTKSWVGIGECMAWPKWHDMNTNKDEMLPQLGLEAASSQGPRNDDHYG